LWRYRREKCFDIPSHCPENRRTESYTSVPMPHTTPPKTRHSPVLSPAFARLVSAQSLSLSCPVRRSSGYGSRLTPDDLSADVHQPRPRLPPASAHLASARLWQPLTRPVRRSHDSRSLPVRCSSGYGSQLTSDDLPAPDVHQSCLRRSRVSCPPRPCPHPFLSAARQASVPPLLFAAHPIPHGSSIPTTIRSRPRRLRTRVAKRWTNCCTASY